ncbi:MAG TPA: hypothetical protein PL009_15155 [Flavipsychrobacter sp.]|nr:hypothetical protein [Flavipsychrobacter sp.]
MRRDTIAPWRDALAVRRDRIAARRDGFVVRRDRFAAWRDGFDAKTEDFRGKTITDWQGAKAFVAPELQTQDSEPLSGW